MLNPARHHRYSPQGLRIASCAVCVALSSFAVLSVAALAQGNDRTRVEKGQDSAGLAQPDRERLNQSLVETARLIQRGEGLLSSIEARMGELEAQDKLLRGSLAQRHDSIARLLSAMQRMGRNPPPVMITQREDALRMVRSAMMLAAAFPELRGQARELTGRLTELARIMDETRSESEKLKAETARLAESRTRLAELMEVRRQSNAASTILANSLSGSTATSWAVRESRRQRPHRRSLSPLPARRLRPSLRRQRSRRSLLPRRHRRSLQPFLPQP
jgi:septal ring factor EnvC (AmiA/AmiB activator)